MAFLAVFQIPNFSKFPNSILAQKKVQGPPLGVPDPGQDSLLFYQTIDKGWKTIKYIIIIEWSIIYITIIEWSIKNLGMTPPHHFQLKNNAISLMVARSYLRRPVPFESEI